MAIVIDTSAVIAAFQNEIDAFQFWQAFEGHDELYLPVTCYLECVMVMRRFGGARQWLDRFVADHEIRLFDCDSAQARLAADAFERFGRGSGHPARLNFGDCLAYAAAASLSAPLLFKGDDFSRTDIMPALAG